jgi:hypothetical protein
MMPRMDARTIAGLSLAFALTLVPTLAAAGSASQLSIAPDGTFTGKNLTVMQVAGTNFFARAIWGQAFVRLTIFASASTTITKNRGGQATTADLAVGDMIDVTGALSTGADSILVNATTIRDNALMKEPKVVSGTITALDPASQSVTLTDKVLGKITVSLLSVSIVKGARTIAFGDLAVGDKLLSAKGIFDYSNSTLTASDAAVYQTQKVFAPRNFDGKLQSLSGTTLPVSLTLLSGGTTYTVYLTASSSVVSKSRTTAALTRFVVGDAVRVFGAIRKTNLTEVDAEVLRDLNF